MSFLKIVCCFVIAVEAVVTEEPVFNRFEYEYDVIEKLVEYAGSIKSLNTQLQELKQKIKELKTDEDISTSYIRWGRSSCPSGATVVYDGFAAGSYFSHKGAAANPICLHKNPKWGNHSEHASTVTFIYGAEYETDSGVLKTLFEQDVPCAVCRVPRSDILMVPGRNDCSQNYTLEYSGFLMSGYHTHPAATEFVCVDREAEATACSSSENRNGYLFYFVHAECGSLKCPPYGRGNEITCAVCSYSPEK